MLPPAALLAMVLVATMPGPGQPPAVVAVPDEPGTVVLPDAEILQTVAADLDDDGRREVVRLVRGADEAALAEVWGLGADGWQLRGDPVEVVPPSRIGARIDPVYESTPVRLLVRRVGADERVTVASQPHFEEIDVGDPCCLLLHDLEIDGGAAVRRAVSDPADFADAIIVIDLDGDGTDELLATRSLPPEGDIGYPILARVHRWTGEAFAAPTVSRLPVGSGDSPFRLGDSDGVPGEEAAIISTLGPPGLFRLRLGEDDALEQDAAGVVADEAVAVALGDRRGVAVSGPVVGLIVATWPPGAALSEPVARSFEMDGRIVGTVEVRGQPRLVVHEPASDALNLLGLPGLLPPQGITITRSPAAAALSGLPLAPFSGPLPGGGPDEEPAIIHAGRLIPSPGDAEVSGTSVVASLVGTEPVGLVWDGEEVLVVLQHGPVGRISPGPGGGALVVPPPLDGSWTSVAPFALTREPEADDADLDPPLRDAIPLDARGGIAVGPGGFIAEVAAPPGSRVLMADFDPSVIRTPIVVPASGRVDAPFVPPTVATANPRYRATLLVVTPAGHAHLATWEVRVLTEPPPAEIRVTTPFGSSAVEVSGRTAGHATVRVDGLPVSVSRDGRFATEVELPPWPTAIVVELDDQVGNVARTTLTGIGFFDYRGLPWVPITALLVVVAGLLLLLRVPRSIPLPRRADDDAALEEIEPD